MKEMLAGLVRGGFGSDVTEDDARARWCTGGAVTPEIQSAIQTEAGELAYGRLTGTVVHECAGGE